MSNNTAKLATIQRIKSLEPIENADRIVLAKFHNVAWQCVVKKDEFKEDELVIYVGLDALLPADAQWAAFLKDKNKPDAPVRIRSVKLRGVLSQGLTLPLTVLPCYATPVSGTPVDDLLNITKYEKPIPANLSGIVKGDFPSFIPKTDEPRLQNAPEVLNELLGKAVYITQKIDGTSATFYRKDGVFGVCSRNLELKDEGDTVYWRLAKELKLDVNLPNNIAFQGEIAGENVQGNQLGLRGQKFFLFNAFDIGRQEYLGYEKMSLMAKELGVERVPYLTAGILGRAINFYFGEVEDFLTYADQQRYPNGEPCEGIVVRTIEEMYSATLRGRASFKVISNTYALKHGE